ncbi:MAG: permease [Caldisericia bacterium]
MILALAFFASLGIPKVKESVDIGLGYVNEYAREHILFSLLPALLIAGAISQLVSTGPVIQILSGRFGRIRAYLVASISGSVLTVCSCTILPIFSGIYRTGAGIGPAISFLFAGPAISVVAVAFTAAIIGWKLALARIISAIVISIIIGLLMEFFFRNEEKERINKLAPIEGTGLPVWKSVIILSMMTLLLISATWDVKTENEGLTIDQAVQSTVVDTNNVSEHEIEFEIIRERIGEEDGLQEEAGNEASKDGGSFDNITRFIYKIKWYLTGLFFLLTVLFSFIFLKKDQAGGWMEATWDLAKEMIPLLFAGVFIAGFLLNIIPESLIQNLLGSNSLLSSFFASILGIGTYFANCTEVAIIDVLLKKDMAMGPALSLLLAGPAVSPPSMIITWSILGAKKSMTYFGLVVLFSTLAGYIYGLLQSIPF